MKRLLFPLVFLAMLAGCADDPSEPYGISQAKKAGSAGAVQPYSNPAPARL